MDLTQIQVLLSGTSPIGWLLALGMIALQIYQRTRKAPSPQPTPAPGPDGIVPAGCTTADLLGILQSLLFHFMERKKRGDLAPAELAMVRATVNEMVKDEPKPS